jgi:hypothetical protein
LEHNNIVGFFTEGYIAVLTAGGFWSLTLFLGFYSLYKRTESFTVVMIAFTLLGGSTGFLSQIVQGIGFEFGWILFVVGIAGLMVKTIWSFKND